MTNLSSIFPSPCPAPPLFPSFAGALGPDGGVGGVGGWLTEIGFRVTTGATATLGATVVEDVVGAAVVTTGTAGAAVPSPCFAGAAAGVVAAVVCFLVSKPLKYHI